MLIVAIPKSASTSLLKTLGRIHRIPVGQEVFPEEPSPPQFEKLAQIHGDIRELSASRATRFGDTGRIFKQHVPPTRNNLGLLKGVPKVVLRRSPEEVVRAYWRGMQTGAHSELPMSKGLDSGEDWMARARDIGLLDEVAEFYSAWGEPADDRLIISYQELVSDSGGVIRKIERFWGWPVTLKPPRLAKERYSRFGPVRHLLMHKMYPRARRTLKARLGRG